VVAGSRSLCTRSMIRVKGGPKTEVLEPRYEITSGERRESAATETLAPGADRAVRVIYEE